MLLRRVSRASAPVLGLADLQDHLRVDAADDNGVLAALAGAAVEKIEGMIGLSMAAEVWALSVSSVCGDLVLPRHPVTGVTTISYFDADDVAQSLNVADFYLFADQRQAVLRPKLGVSWPVTRVREDAVTVTFATGMAELPQVLRVAALLVAGHLYRNREAASDAAQHEIPLGVAALIEDYKRVWVV